MQAAFSITVDVPRSLVRIHMSGFFASGDISRFVDARDQAHNLLKCRPNEHLTLVDIRDMDIQAQDSVARFQIVLANTSKVSKRIAFIVAQSLSRMQIKRAAHNRDAGYFSDISEAELWLLKGNSDPY